MAHKAKDNKASTMFIKKVDHKSSDIIKPKEVLVVKVKIKNKKWEAKKVEDAKASKFQGNIPTKSEEKVSRALVSSDRSHQTVAIVVDRHKEKKGMVVDVPFDSSIDMISILSQVTVKVPLSELLRIPKHRDKSIAWVGGVDKKMKNDSNENHTPKDGSQNKMKDRELEVFVSQIPQIFLDNYVN